MNIGWNTTRNDIGPCRKLFWVKQSGQISSCLIKGLLYIYISIRGLKHYGQGLKGWYSTFFSDVFSGDRWSTIWVKVKYDLSFAPSNPYTYIYIYMHEWFLKHQLLQFGSLWILEANWCVEITSGCLSLGSAWDDKSWVLKGLEEDPPQMDPTFRLFFSFFVTFQKWSFVNIRSH